MTLVDTAAAAAHVRLHHGRDCAPATIRSWLHRGWLTRHGRDGRRTLVDLAEVDQRVESATLDR